MNRIPGWMACAAVLAALVATSGCGGGRAADAQANKGAPADTAMLAAEDVAAVVTTDLAAGIPVSGTLAPGWRVRLTSPIDEVVEDVLVREGERVAPGQVLARYRLGTVAADAASAKAALATASADRDRQKNLLAEGAVSERDAQAAEAAWRAAAAQNELMQRRLADATVRAPRAGTLTTRSVQSGDRVAKGDPLFVVADTHELEFDATVPSSDVPRVKVGAPVRLAVSGFTAGAIEGHVARINATADPSTRQVKVYVTVPNADGRLVGDLFASGSILTDQAQHALAAPSAGVRRDASGEFAWVVDPAGRAARRAVRSGVRDDAHDLLQVVSGLAAGERVIVGPAEGLTQGQPVHVAGRER